MRALTDKMPRVGAWQKVDINRLQRLQKLQNAGIPRIFTSFSPSRTASAAEMGEMQVEHSLRRALRVGNKKVRAILKREEAKSEEVG